MAIDFCFFPQDECRFLSHFSPQAIKLTVSLFLNAVCFVEVLMCVCVRDKEKRQRVCGGFTVPRKYKIFIRS